MTEDVVCAGNACFGDKYASQADVVWGGVVYSRYWFDRKHLVPVHWTTETFMAGEHASEIHDAGLPVR
jgi:hypothetical protein